MYSEYGEKPKFEASEGVFKVTLKNINEIEKRRINRDKKSTGRMNTESEKTTVYEFAVAHGGVTRKEAEDILQCKLTKAFKILTELCNENKLASNGSGKHMRYIVVGND